MATLNDLLVTGSARFVNTINGKVNQAIRDGSGNIISSYYCTLNTNQTIAGTKTFQANIQVNGLKALTAVDSTSYGLGTAGQVLKSNGTSVYWDNFSLATATTLGGVYLHYGPEEPAEKMSRTIWLCPIS